MRPPCRPWQSKTCHSVHGQGMTRRLQHASSSSTIYRSGRVASRSSAIMLETIYITRHGFRTNWEHTKWSPSPTGIDRDPPLSSHGVVQAKEMAAHLTTIKPKIDRIYCSPFYRCLQTIAYTADALDLPIHIDNGIGEWYGVTTGRHPSPATKQVLRGFFPRVDLDYEPSLVPTTRGETMEDIHERVKQAMALVIQDAERHGCKAIVLCTHAATNVSATISLPSPQYRILTMTDCTR